MTKNVLIKNLKAGHEYQWSYNGKRYSLLPRNNTGMIFFYMEGSEGKEYSSVDEIITSGYDLLTMMNDNPTLDEF